MLPNNPFKKLFLLLIQKAQEGKIMLQNHLKNVSKVQWRFAAFNNKRGRTLFAPFQRAIENQLTGNSTRPKFCFGIFSSPAVKFVQVFLPGETMSEPDWQHAQSFMQLSFSNLSFHCTVFTQIQRT